MSSEDLTLSDRANPPARDGWITVMTPMGASAQAVINSAAWDACTKWQLLNSERGPLTRTNAF